MCRALFSLRLRTGVSIETCRPCRVTVAHIQREAQGRIHTRQGEARRMSMGTMAMVDPQVQEEAMVAADTEEGGVEVTLGEEEVMTV